MKKWSKYIIGAFVVIGGCIGTAVIAPSFNLGEDAGALLGMFLGFLVTLLIPNLWKSFLNLVNDEHKTATEEKQYITFTESLTHPTQLPMIIGFLWFIGFMIIMLLFDTQISTTADILLLLLLLPSLILFGTSGFLMVKRKEFVSGGMFGYKVVRGTWAIISGIAGMLFGWGIGILLVLSLIFKW